MDWQIGRRYRLRTFDGRETIRVLARITYEGHPLFCLERDWQAEREPWEKVPVIGWPGEAIIGAAGGPRGGA